MAKNSVRIVPETAQDAKNATAHGEALRNAWYALVGAVYDAASDRFTFTLRNGNRLEVPRANIEVDAIANANPSQLQRTKIDYFGTHVLFPDLGEGLNPVGMFLNIADTALQAERGRAGGQKKSAAKAAAAKANGRRGGRPKRKELADAKA